MREGGHETYMDTTNVSAPECNPSSPNQTIENSNL